MLSGKMLECLKNLCMIRKLLGIVYWNQDCDRLKLHSIKSVYI